LFCFVRADSLNCDGLAAELPQLELAAALDLFREVWYK
jgi:hypothetical protein